MPWWSWLLIWTGLACALLGMLAWFGYALFRKLVALTDAAGALGDQLADAYPDPDADPDADSDPAGPGVFRPAIFADARELATAVALRRAERELRRQVRRDRRITRGKLLQHGPIVPLAPLKKRTDPHA